MSEYTAIHTENIDALRDELNNLGWTSFLLSDFAHPLAKSDDIVNQWQDLSHQQKWLILVTKQACDITLLENITHSIDLMIHERPELWRISFSTNGNTYTLLFSDKPWGDLCAVDPNDDWQSIERANNISEDDLQMMEDVFQLKRQTFQDFLKMGRSMVWQFLEATGLPALEMFCDYSCYHPAAGEGRCMLWDEYTQLAG
ncbi:hypothetical protein [Microbulbifer sp. 2205BS26-8]|uniref:hypothetical protein n=1 Tax=Microbulbifer sp. 2205BS26-8 TaxID=3064386 RepID=UPI00273FEFCB|nr:hypothetical protein [Microbulbifer sp. 2205BS26-8]MDP5209776.1 hypothetical protein [Microbulbifer sp. 2205BS26-8]